jgi:hypothetical protein
MGTLTANNSRNLNIPTGALSRIISVDGYESSLFSFLYENLEGEDVDHITDEHAQAVIDLGVGERLGIGMAIVERMS